MTNDADDTDDDSGHHDHLCGDTLDHLCWYVVSHLDSFAWPDEQAARALAGREDYTDRTVAREEGYFMGAFNMWEDFAAYLDQYVDVLARATHYAEANDLPEFDLVTPERVAASGYGLYLGSPDRDLIDVAERASEIEVPDPDDTATDVATDADVGE